MAFEGPLRRRWWRRAVRIWESVECRLGCNKGFSQVVKADFCCIWKTLVSDKLLKSKFLSDILNLLSSDFYI